MSESLICDMHKDFCWCKNSMNMCMYIKKYTHMHNLSLLPTFLNFNQMTYRILHYFHRCDAQLITGVLGNGLQGGMAHDLLLDLHTGLED